ncbi:MAG: hypothetical protein QXX34_00525 [Candidatus Bathyarchaeia archaeon]
MTKTCRENRENGGDKNELRNLKNAIVEQILLLFGILVVHQHRSQKH